MSLDANDNRNARDAAKLAAHPVPPLNPPFPYAPRPFDPWVFDAQLDAPKKKPETDQ